MRTTLEVGEAQGFAEPEYCAVENEPEILMLEHVAAVVDDDTGEGFVVVEEAVEGVAAAATGQVVDVGMRTVAHQEEDTGTANLWGVVEKEEVSELDREIDAAVPASLVHVAQALVPETAGIEPLAEGDQTHKEMYR